MSSGCRSCRTICCAPRSKSCGRAARSSIAPARSKPRRGRAGSRRCCARARLWRGGRSSPTRSASPTGSPKAAICAHCRAICPNMMGSTGSTPRGSSSSKVSGGRRSAAGACRACLPGAAFLVTKRDGLSRWTARPQLPRISAPGMVPWRALAGGLAPMKSGAARSPDRRKRELSRAGRPVTLRDMFVQWRGDAWRALASTPFYRQTLIGPAPSALRLKLNERWPGDSRRGNAVLAGNIEFAGTLIRRPTPAWFPPDATAGWLSRWHGFGWLDDLMAIGTSARDPARVLIQSWLSEGAAWHPVTWRPDVAVTRILAWIVHFEELAGRDADRALRRAMLASIAAQVRHLARVAGWELTGAARLRALKGLIGGSVALGGPEQRILRALRGLERELSTQILPDGGHLTRNPSVQLQVLRDLIDIRAVLRAATLDVPAALTQTIQAMAPMLPFFRHGDRGLARFI